MSGSSARKKGPIAPRPSSPTMRSRPSVFRSTEVPRSLIMVSRHFKAEGAAKKLQKLQAEQARRVLAHHDVDGALDAVGMRHISGLAEVGGDHHAAGADFLHRLCDIFGIHLRPVGKEGQGRVRTGEELE